MGAIHRPEGSEDKMTIVVVATHKEYIIAKAKFKGKRVIETGVGPLNIIHSLRKIPKWVRIINFGYAGSNNLPIGTEVCVGFSTGYHENVQYLEPAYVMDDNQNGENDVWCYTSNDFVLKAPKTTATCLFDMELAYIMALGFKHVRSIKIVSDNLSLEQYEEEMK